MPGLARTRACASAPSYLCRMHSTGFGPLKANVLWFPTRRNSREGRACREYEVTDEAGGVLLAARSFIWGREIIVTDPVGDALLTIIRSRAFPVTGKATVTELPSGASIGTVHRSGTFRDPTGFVRGRFQDARSFRERTTESVFQGVMEALLATGADSMPSGPDALVLEIDGVPAGTLTYGVLPFAPGGSAIQCSPSSKLPRFLKKKWQSLNAPRGWKLVRTVTNDGDPRLQLAAALFAADMSRW